MNWDISRHKEIRKHLSDVPFVYTAEFYDALFEIERLTAELAVMSERLHDEMSQLEIATDLGNKRWVALNDIYENGEKHNANWCKRRAQKGIGFDVS